MHKHRTSVYYGSDSRRPVVPWTMGVKHERGWTYCGRIRMPQNYIFWSFFIFWLHTFIYIFNMDSFYIIFCLMYNVDTTLTILTFHKSISFWYYHCFLPLYCSLPRLPAYRGYHSRTAQRCMAFSPGHVPVSFYISVWYKYTWSALSYLAIFLLLKKITSLLNDVTNLLTVMILTRLWQYLPLYFDVANLFTMTR